MATFKDRVYPILLTDWIMPEMVDLTLCRAIRERITDGYVFIVLLGFEAGAADDYLTSPLNLDRSANRNGLRLASISSSGLKKNSRG